MTRNGIGFFLCAGALAILAFAPLSGADAAKLKTLYAFAGGAGDGAYPVSGLFRDSAGNFFGTSAAGGGTGCGGSGCGTVFKFATDGSETVLYAFQGGNDGASPFSGLIMDSAGNLYGATEAGGGNGCSGGGCGTVYKLATDGTETVLHAFKGGADGANPYNQPVMDANGNLYGTAVFGGTVNDSCSAGCGTVYKISPNGKLSVLYSFTGGRDGAAPYPPPILDKKGNLYGAAGGGGKANSDCSSGFCGTVYKLAPNGSLKVLYAFKGGSDGGNPTSTLSADKIGNFYSTTYGGGDYTNCATEGCGTVFKLAPDGTKTTLYTFTGESDGAVSSESGVVLDKSGNLFGTTIQAGDFSCGSDGCGTAYEISSAGTETTLHTFTGGKDGAISYSPLIDLKGNLYGTAELGGVDNANCTYGCGVIYEIKP